MIKVTCNEGMVNVHEVNGSGIRIISELCCIVAAVCEGWCSDEEESIRDFMKHVMILQVASALKEHEVLLHGEEVSE